MAKEQPNVSELLPLLESSDLQELEHVKAAINDDLSSDRGSMLLNGLVDYYMETNSTQAILLLCSVREPHDKHLFDKLNESLARPPCRLATLTLLGHVIRRQPSWIHKITRFPLLASVLKCLKTDCDVMVLITGVLVLITLLPMIPQAGRQHIYDFFDIFGRLASWSLKNPGHVHGVFLIHLHASVYSLFHRLYGMYPCNFISYLRSHYSMKENLGTFEEVVKPMLEHVRVHPELVTGTQDLELDPSRWKRFEIHDIMIQCAKVSLDPKEASCEEGYSSVPDPLPLHPPSRLHDSTVSPHPDHHHSYGRSTSTPLPVGQPALSLSLPQLVSPRVSLSSLQTPCLQISNCDLSESKPMWSPSSECHMSTPPTSRRISPANVSDPWQSPQGPASIAPAGPGAKCPPPAAVHAPPPHAPALFEEHIRTPSANSTSQKRQPIGELERGVSQPIREGDGSKPEVIDNGTKGAGGEKASVSLTELADFVQKHNVDLLHGPSPETEDGEDSITEEILKLTASQTGPDGSFYSSSEYHSLSSLQASDQSLNKGSPAPAPDGLEGSSVLASQPLAWCLPPGFTPIASHVRGGRLEQVEGAGRPGRGHLSSTPPGDAAPPYEALFGLALPRAACLFLSRKAWEVSRREAGGEGGGEGEEEGTAWSPLEALDRLIQQGNDAHSQLMKRPQVPFKSEDWTHFGGKQQGMKAKGSGPMDEVQALRSQLVLMHNQLQFERYKREQHAIRNRRLLRRIINATALEEQNHSMKAQLKMQELEEQALQASLQQEQQRSRQLRLDTLAETSQLHGRIALLQEQHHDYLTKTQRLQSELEECQGRMAELESELQKASYEAYNAEHQLTQLSLKLSDSEELQEHMFLLNRQLLLLGETNKLCMEEAQRVGPKSDKELLMLQWSLRKEAECLRQGEAQQSRRLEAAQQRLADTEAQLAKKEHLILEQKKFLEDIKAKARGQLQASESRYVALRCVTQALQTEMLQLYGQLDLQTQASNSLLEPADSQASSPSRPNGSSSGVPVSQGSLKSVGQATAPGIPPSSSATVPTPGGHPSSASTNGSLEELPLVNEASPLHHLLASSPITPSPASAPMDVGSYPSAKSFLGMHARGLFQSKSDSQEGEGEPEAQLGSLSLEEAAEEEEGGSQPPDQGLIQPSSLQLGAPAPPPQGPGQPAPSQVPALPGRLAPAGPHPRRPNLSIMDYNETQHS
ncbi:hamartin-like isoform X1 [Osmerus eperlanus]|uniref:hamartin-like isoform X1 n=1 Tax=Osmerus eperlanus TaxID=29151 RepID=UPI002E10D6BE